MPRTAATGGGRYIRATAVGGMNMLTNRRMLLVGIAAWSAASVACAFAQETWTEVVPGIEYRAYTLEGPIRVFVTRADRSRSDWIFDTMIAQGSLRHGRETVPDMVARYDDSVNFAGQRYEIKAAVNGSYFHPPTGVPMAGQIVAGWYAFRFGEYSGGTGFVWKFNRDFVLAGNVRNWPQLQHVVFENDAQVSIDQLNTPRGADELAVFTSHYDDRTCTTGDGVEIVVQLGGPLHVVPTSDQNIGTIMDIRHEADPALLRFDQVVISAGGKAAFEVLKHARVGQKVRFDMGLIDYGNEDLNLGKSDWRGAYAGMTGHCYCLVDGVVHSEHWEAKARAKVAAGGKSGAIVQDPRTALAANDAYLFFVVIDGRSPASKGMTFTQAGEFCRDTLKAKDAILQDGGGSSIMWVDGKVVNEPSDGHPRAVANGFLLARVHDPETSTDYQSGGRVTSTSLITDLRLGPGSHYGVVASVPPDREGTVIEHAMNGIQAKGANWWYCRFGRIEGWVSSRQLAALPE